MPLSINQYNYRWVKSSRILTLMLDRLYYGLVIFWFFCFDLCFTEFLHSCHFSPGNEVEPNGQILTEDSPDVSRL